MAVRAKPGALIKIDKEAVKDIKRSDFEQAVTNLSWKAYDRACEKHPQFCSGLLDTREVKWKDSETAIKRRCNSHLTADNIVMEELAETFSAVEAGNYGQAIHEAYDTIAVMIRLIETLEPLCAGEGSNGQG